MYEDYLKAILTWIQAINAAEKKLADDPDRDESLSPYLGRIAVLMEGELCGFLADEIGGCWSYQNMTDAEREWWAARPRG